MKIRFICENISFDKYHDKTIFVECKIYTNRYKHDAKIYNKTISLSLTIVK